MSTFTNLIDDVLTAYKEGRLGDAFNDLSDASVALEQETLDKLENSENDSVENSKGGD